MNLTKPRRSSLNFLRFALSLRNGWLWAVEVFVTLTILSVFYVTTPPVLYLKYISGSFLIFYLPGAILLEMIYQRRSDLEALERVAFSIGLSIIIVVLTGLFLNNTLLGITPYSVTISLSLFIEVIVFFAFSRKYACYKHQLGVIPEESLSISNNTYTEPARSQYQNPKKESEVKLVEKICVFAAILSYGFLAVFGLTLPHFDYAEPNVFFHINSLPPVYWIGVLTSILGLFSNILCRRRGNSRKFWGLLALFSFVAYTNCIPMLMYRNRIWFDTYPFVADVFYTLKYNHINPDPRATETPGISVFSSQFCMVTGLDDQTVAMFVSYLMPLLAALFIFLMAQVFLGYEGAVLATFLYFSLNWYGFYFNRRTFSLLPQMFTWYMLARTLTTERHSRFEYVVTILSFTAIVLSHIAVSFFMILDIIAPIILYPIVSLIPRIIKAGESTTLSHISGKTRCKTFAVMFIIIWISWYGIQYSSIHLAADEILQLTFIRTSTKYVGIYSVNIKFGGYTLDYMFITRMELFEVLFTYAIAGVALLCFFKGTDRWRAILFSSWFLSNVSYIAIANYAPAHAWMTLPKPFIQALPLLVIPISWFLMHYHPMRHSVKMTSLKVVVLGIFVFAAATLPVTMYADMSFIYPSTATLKFTDFVIKYGSEHAHAVLMGSHQEFVYFAYVNDARNKIFKSLPLRMEWTLDEILSNDIIGRVFRLNAKSAFETSSNVVMQNMSIIEGRLTTDPKLGFARVYVGNSFHVAYTKQSKG